MLADIQGRIGRAMGPLLAACALSLAAAPAWADAGRDLFEAQCAGCHPLSGHSIPDGPSLKGVVWRKIAVLRDFKYSAALKAQVGTWSPQRLNAYLRNTQAFAAGTSMFWTISDADERKAIVRYLESQ
ncbi:MAG TPA: c-type cytochrome [Caulobacteraceae bacterium]|nr:c-type cytochrome [Caulobacteraceae bacterium]